MENPNNQVTVEERKKALQSAVYFFTNAEPFYGSLIQTITIKFDNRIPTACLKYDSKLESFEVLLNDQFFCSMKPEEKIAVLHHEMLHFTNKHLFRLPFEGSSDEDRQLFNISGDMSINQYIQNLPEGGIKVSDFKLDNGSPFPKLKSMEEYYELLKNNQKHNKEMLKGMQTLDVHDWFESLTEEERQKMLQEAKNVLKRTLEKTQFGHTRVPDSIKELLEEIDTLTAKLNYKEILRKVLKRTVCTSDRDHSWKRPNKRYGNVAPGTKNGNMPQLSIYVDSSGSISVTEMNQFMHIINGFLKSGSRTCNLGLWHTNLYYKKRFKLNQPIENDMIESGGTDVDCVIKDIVKTNPNLSIVLTDGYFDTPDTNLPKDKETIFIISKGGNKDHPLTKYGKTILLENLL